MERLNIKFLILILLLPGCQIVEVSNNELKMRNAEIDELILMNGTSLPSSIGLEKKTNPFLRCDLLNDNIRVMQEFGLNNPSEEEMFRYIREWKDST